MKGASNIAPFGLRMPEELKTKISARAKKNGRSMNAEIVQMLEDLMYIEDKKSGRLGLLEMYKSDTPFKVREDPSHRCSTENKWVKITNDPHRLDDGVTLTTTDGPVTINKARLDEITSSITSEIAKSIIERVSKDSANAVAKAIIERFSLNQKP